MCGMAIISSTQDLLWQFCLAIWPWMESMWVFKPLHWKITRHLRTTGCRGLILLDSINIHSTINIIVRLLVIAHFFSCAVGQHGAVSTLDLSVDGTRLLCGHSKGLVRPAHQHVMLLTIAPVDVDAKWSSTMQFQRAKFSLCISGITLCWCICTVEPLYSTWTHWDHWIVCPEGGSTV